MALAPSPEIEALDKWRKEGELARDTGAVNPHPANTIAGYMHGCGWLKRDLQLCLARAKPGYRRSQIQFKTITKEGIEGGYPFDTNSPYTD